MKNKVLLAALACMAFAGCTNDEVMFDEALKSKEIRLAVATGTAQTRAEHDKDGAYGGKLYVWAWEKGSTDPIIDGDVYDASTNTFEENKLYYYPVNGNDVDFLVVPKEIVDNDYFSEPTRNDGGTTDFVFTVGHDAAHGGTEHKLNLMTSEIITQNNTQNGGVVGVILRHLTSKLNVRVIQTQRQNDATTVVATVNKLQLKGIKNTGSVELDEEWSAVNEGRDCMWTEVDENEKCTWEILASDHVLASHDMGASINSYETSGNFYVLPQEFTAGEQQFYIEYTVETKYKNNLQPTVTEKFSKTIDVKDIATVSHWAMNKNITYIISINPIEDSHKITFDVEEEAWGNMNGETTVTPGESNNK